MKPTYFHIIEYYAGIKRNKRNKRKEQCAKQKTAYMPLV
jgi:hypothetical protein